MSAEANRKIEGAVGSKLAIITGGEWSLHDDGAASGLYDLDLSLVDGRQAAVEVTGLVSSDAMRALTASAKRGYVVDGLTGFWDVHLIDFESEKRKRIHDAVPVLLVEFESNDRDAVTTDDDSRLAALGIQSVTRHGLGSSFVLSGTGGTCIGPNDVEEPVIELACRLDNLAKLQRSDADERHVAVWVDVTASNTYAALNDLGFLPPGDVSVPDAIDVIWALRMDTSGEGIGFDIVWRWSRASGWTDESHANGAAESSQKTRQDK